MATTSECLVRPLAAMRPNHSCSDLPYRASMLRTWAAMPSSTLAMAASLCPRLSPRPVVLNPVRQDLPGVDRGELVSLAGAGQVGEEIGAVTELAGLEPDLQLAQDVLARVQPLAVRPRPAVDVPGPPRGPPLLVAVVQPAAVFAGRGQPGEAPPRGGLVEAFAGPLHHHQDPGRHQ